MDHWSELVDVEQRTVSRRLFSDSEIYRAEQGRIFGRCWLYVAHESQIPQPGDFVTTTMGEEPVIVCRDEDGQVHVLVDSCRHRGIRVCRADQGNAREFRCPYHGWTYNLKGQLVSVPLYQEAYYGDLELGRWGLVAVPRVESYRGLIFANFDKGAESLDVYLGETQWYLDIVLNRTPGGLVMLPGTHKWSIKANWKFGAEQFSGDNYHVGFTHGAFLKLGWFAEEEAPQTKTPWVFRVRPLEAEFQVKTKEGYGWIILRPFDYPGIPAGVKEELRTFQAWVRAEAGERLSPAQAKLVNATYVSTLFPNFSILVAFGFVSFRVWHPRGPNRMEVWSWALVDREAPPAVVQLARDSQIRTFSPPGIFEVDDLEMWEGCSEGCRGFYSQRFPLNYQMGARHELRDPERPGVMLPPPTEIGVFGFYERWRALMSDGERRVER